MFKKGDIVSIDTSIAENNDNWPSIGIVPSMRTILKKIDEKIIENSFIVLSKQFDTSSSRNIYYKLMLVGDHKDSDSWNWYESMIRKKRVNIFEDDSEFTL